MFSTFDKPTSDLVVLEFNNVEILVKPVPPDETASVDDRPAAVPVVFWFQVGTVPPKSL